jgi:hypothetical protein
MDMLKGIFVIMVTCAAASTIAKADPRTGTCSGKAEKNGKEYYLIGKHQGKPLACNFYPEQQAIVMALCPPSSICRVTGTVDEIGDNGTDLLVENITAVTNISKR